MKAPSINLARRPFRNNTVHYAVFGACLVLLTAASAVNVREFLLRGDELAQLRDQFDAGTQRYDGLFQDVERMKREISQVNLALLDNKSAFVNGLIVSRFFSWSRLFDRLEGIIPYDVRIRSIRPSITPKQIEIQVDGMAKSAIDLYEFEAGLAASEYFAGVYPTNENQRESRNEINFDLAMTYIPAGKSGLTPSPPSPTASIPQAEPEGAAAGGTETAAVADEAEVEAGPASAGAAGTDAAAEPGSGAARAAGAAAGPATPAPTRSDGSASPARGAGPAGEPEAASPAGAEGTTAGRMMQMTNREFIEKRGEPVFMRARGGLVPSVPDEHPDLDNAEYIGRFGLEVFLEKRGSLSMLRQVRKPQSNPGPPQDPAAAPPPERKP